MIYVWIALAVLLWIAVLAVAIGKTLRVLELEDELAEVYLAISHLSEIETMLPRETAAAREAERAAIVAHRRRREA